MITRLGVEDGNLNSKYITTTRNKNSTQSNPNFKGGGVWNALLWGIQRCEANPMVNVAVIDMISAILPRTFVESLTNWFAGFEAFRRESSGLVVNCLIPGIIAWLGAVGLNNFIMPKGSNMSSCWADHSLIQKATELYSNSKADDKIRDSIKEILENTEGTKNKKTVVFKDALKEEEITAYVDKLRELSKSDMKTKPLEQEVEKIAKEITSKTNVYENVKIRGEKPVKATTLKTLLEDTVKYFREYEHVSKNVSIEEFAKRSKKLVKGKSIFGLAITLPLAASMQYINRWITKKVSGIEGAPIYEDYGKEQNEQVRKKSQEGLLRQKIISISAMIGVSLLSMMKRPTWSMLEFKGWFPTMDQARVISTTTFASRMAVADDKNELAEATIRDITTFSGLYFLGDYAGKAAATILQKQTGVQLLNDTNPKNNKGNILKRFWHWVQDVNVKSSQEVLSKTAEKLKEQGITPNKEQQKIIQKELQRAGHLRSACQAVNLGVSLLLLGLIVPMWTRNATKRKHAETIKQVQENNIQSDVGIKNDDSAKSSVSKTA